MLRNWMKFVSKIVFYIVILCTFCRYHLNEKKQIIFDIFFQCILLIYPPTLKVLDLFKRHRYLAQ